VGWWCLQQGVLFSVRTWYIATNTALLTWLAKHIATDIATDIFLYFLLFWPVCYSPPLIGGALSDDAVWHLSVCLLRTSGLSREQRGLWKPRYTWLGHHFKGQNVKSQGHQAPLLTAMLARQAAAAVGVGTCWPWETASALTGSRGAGSLWRPTAYSLFYINNRLHYLSAFLFTQKLRMCNGVRKTSHAAARRIVLCANLMCMSRVWRRYN